MTVQSQDDRIIEIIKDISELRGENLSKRGNYFEKLKRVRIGIGSDKHPNGHMYYGTIVLVPENKMGQFKDIRLKFVDDPSLYENNELPHPNFTSLSYFINFQAMHSYISLLHNRTNFDNYTIGLIIGPDRVYVDLSL